MKIFLLLLTLATGTLAQAQQPFTFIGAGIPSGPSAISNSSETILTFFQSGGRVAYVSNSDTFYLDPIPQDQKVFGYFRQIGQSVTNDLPTTGTPLHLSSNDMAAWVSNRTGLVSAAPAGFPTTSCQGCIIVSTFPATQIGGAADNLNVNIVKNLDINTLAAYYPNSNNAWLTAQGADSGVAITSLTVYTASRLLPNNMNGSIAISQIAGSLFGMATDSTGGRIGWLNTSGSSLIFRDGKVLTNANIIDNGILTTTGIAVTDHAWTGAPALGNIQGLFSSNSPAGNGILVDNTFPGPDANTFITLQQGKYANTLMTVSAFSTDPRYSAGSFVMVSRGPNGIQFDVESDGTEQSQSIRFSFHGEEYARFERGVGFISHRPLRYPGYTTAERKALTKVEPGEMVYDTDKKRYFGYGDSGWYSISMKRER